MHRRALGEREILLYGWRVTNFSGELELHCHNECIWLPPSRALALPLAEADAPLIQALMAQDAAQ